MISRSDTGRTGRPRGRHRSALTAAACFAALLTGCTQAGPAGSAAATGPSAPAGPEAGTAPGPERGTGARAQGRTPEGTLLVADFGSDTVTFVDPDKGPIDSVKVGTAPYGLAVGADGRAWVATAEGVAVLDTAARTRLAVVPYRTAGLGPATYGEYRGGGMGIALAPDGRHVYVGVNVPGGKGTLEVVDTQTLKVTGSAGTGRRPFDVDVSRDGSQAYATGHDSFDVTVVATDTLDTRRIEVAPYGTEGGLGSWLKPHYTAVRPSDGRLLLPFEGEKLVVVDPGTGRSTVERMTANAHQHGAAVTADGTLLVVGTGPIDPSTDEGPSLTVRAPDGKEKVIPLDGPHEDVTVSKDGRTAYVTGGFTRDGHWNGITVVDLDAGRAHRLPAGQRPLGIAVL
ncbi:YncE family protein [Streptomyces sp. IBSNAI002]|uniref:YncE family protein n=1 Tax=Streptomyces sp. IBSNAI002 TaxID=3457500 RepID=UPI003FD4960C